MINNLKNILRQDDTVLFVGSGISVWSGLPSWSGLIKELIAFIKDNGLNASLTEQELSRGDLLQAASYGFDVLTNPMFARFIRESCKLGVVKPHAIHQKIVNLGPRCYITTNYDKLLKQSFSLWAPDTYFRTVVNTQLTETGEITGARATNFLFKLHGDVEDSRSIILTREQYRSLNAGGEFNYALETAKTLMLSRPIVYIGFGLKDPDFLLIRDLIHNTHKGSTRDHYAIMGDVTSQEADFYRKNYGIHLVGYNTILKADGKKDYTPLLDLLDALKREVVEEQVPEFKMDDAFILSLTRHAAKYSNIQEPKLHLPLDVSYLEQKQDVNKNIELLQYNNISVEKILDSGPDRFILIGLPGSGKSYSIKSSVARLAKN